MKACEKMFVGSSLIFLMCAVTSVLYAISKTFLDEEVMLLIIAGASGGLWGVSASYWMKIWMDELYKEKLNSKERIGLAILSIICIVITALIATYG